MLTGSEKPETIHDFYNFPSRSTGCATRARRTGRREARAGAPQGCRLHRRHRRLPRPRPRRLVAPLYMYPQADVPVVQISVQPALGPRHHVTLGKAVGKLADEGVLIIGSGHMTHNLRDWARGQGAGALRARVPGLGVRQARSEDVESLVDYRSRSPHAVRAHPTDEHFLPLFFALHPKRGYDVVGAFRARLRHRRGRRLLRDGIFLPQEVPLVIQDGRYLWAVLAALVIGGLAQPSPTASPGAVSLCRRGGHRCLCRLWRQQVADRRRVARSRCAGGPVVTRWAAA